MPSSKHASKKGFTLIELLLGLTLFFAGTVAILSLTIVSLDLNTSTTRNMQALELAQEGIESVRNIRDSLWKNNYYFWQAEPLFGENFDQRKFVVISPQFNADVAWNIQEVAESDTNSMKIYKNQDNGIITFSHASSGEETAFYRFIEITPLTKDLIPTNDTASMRAFEAKVSVWWLKNGKKRQIELSHIFTDWKKI